MNIFNVIRRQKWDLAIAAIDKGHTWDAPFWEFKIIKAPRKSWYADPFILDVTDVNIYVLVEEYTYSINKGRLAILTIDRSSKLITDEEIILELPTHLSFPSIIRRGDDVFILPENSESGCLNVYKFDFEKRKLYDCKLLVKEPLTDAVYCNFFGTDTIFATRIPNQNGNVLNIYELKDGNFVLKQNVVLADNVARSAGNLFKTKDDMVIRPAQNCNESYGKGIVFQEIRKSKNGLYEIRELFRKDPFKGYDGMHTYNQYKGYAIIDLHKNRYPNIHSFLRMIKCLCKEMISLK